MRYELTDFEWSAIKPFLPNCACKTYASELGWPLIILRPD